MKLLNRSALMAKLSMKRTTLGRLIYEDDSFPRPVRPLGSHPFWREDEVDAWIAGLQHDERRSA